MSKLSNTKNSNPILKFFKQIFSNTHWLPIFLCCTILGVLFVLFRMKVVEIDYKTTDLIHKIDKIRLEKKEIEAQKAKLLSIENLRNLAKKHNLKQPQRKQIIVIPKVKTDGI